MTPVGEWFVVRKHHDRVPLDLDLLVLRLDRVSAAEHLALDPEVRRLLPLERETQARIALNPVEPALRWIASTRPTLLGVARLAHAGSFPELAAASPLQRSPVVPPHPDRWLDCCRPLPGTGGRNDSLPVSAPLSRAAPLEAVEGPDSPRLGSTGATAGGATELVVVIDTGVQDAMDLLEQVAISLH